MPKTDHDIEQECLDALSESVQAIRNGQSPDAAMVTFKHKMDEIDEHHPVPLLDWILP